MALALFRPHALALASMLAAHGVSTAQTTITDPPQAAPAP